MRREAKPLQVPDSNELEARAWRSLLAASAASRRENRAPDLEWLRRHGDEYAAAANAPEAVRALLELYAPLCNAHAGRPLTVAHLGQSLDGHIATASGDSYYVTGPDNVRHLHRLRALSGAVVASENAANPAEDTRDQRRDDLRRDARGFPSRKNGERPSLSPAAWRLARSRGHEREFLFERASVAGCARARADAPQ